jgi:hypothetical protein
MRRSPAEADAALAPGKFARALAQPMRRDLDIPHWTVPVPAETESDSNTHSKQVLSVTQQAAPSVACTQHHI